MAKKFSLILIVLLALSLCFLCGCYTRALSKVTPSPTTIPATAATPIITPEPVITPTQEPTPTISSAAYLHSTGGYYMNEWYNLSRVSRDLKTAILVHITTYRYQFRDSYRYWDTVAQQWLWVDPPQGYKFLFVFVNTWMDDSARNSSNPIDGYDYTHFTLQYNGALIPGTVDLHHINELQAYSNLFKTGYVVPFGYQWETNPFSYKRVLNPLPSLEPGRGNSWDGYIIYVVPKDTKPDDLKVVGNFEGMGSAYWIFQGGDSFSITGL
ncbi:MAG: hypothetical protein ABSD81_06835 [Methanomicrobiales archaeon]|jgi:hypothetical protein